MSDQELQQLLAHLGTLAGNEEARGVVERLQHTIDARLRRAEQSQTTATAGMATPASEPTTVVSERPYRKVSDLEQIPYYNGRYEREAAEKWLRRVDQFFEDERILAQKNATDLEKVTVVKRKFTGSARERWEARENCVAAGTELPITTLNELKQWVRNNFSEYLSETKRWEAYERCVQGTKTVQAYASALAEAATRISPPLPEHVRIRKFVVGTKKSLHAMWTREPNPPTTFDGVVQKFVQYEQGIAMANHVQHRSTYGNRQPAADDRHTDPMDLNALHGSDNRRNGGHRTPRERGGSGQGPKCYRCNERGHIARECRSKSDTGDSKQGKAHGR
ncbi:hypothetical protein ETB97_010550 [Aspergillus alliaceus]|uniref:CCHC-type domain-containing protein n=1 Tax=Petromyces alliaceus TaxID=209559 RepID=A0A8H6E0L8_PETAA|nr:hypothetical protein ETB97_010550 [Aspergillus burnettii]